MQDFFHQRYGGHSFITTAAIDFRRLNFPRGAKNLYRRFNLGLTFYTKKLRSLRSIPYPSSKMLYQMASYRNINHSTSHFLMHLLFSKESHHISQCHVMFRWCWGGLCKVNLKSSRCCALLSHPKGLFFCGTTPQRMNRFPHPDEKFFQMLGRFEWLYPDKGR